MQNIKIKLVLFLIIISSVCIANTRKFSNPISPCSPEDYADPSIVFYNGYYYAVNSENNTSQIAIYKSRYLESVYYGSKVIVWTALSGTNQSEAIWAPYLQNINGIWYIYYTASFGGNSMNHRMYAIKGDTSDPAGNYTSCGLIDTYQQNVSTIDGKVMVKPVDGSLYFVWSGSSVLYNSDLYIAKMSNPTTISSPALKISQNTASWESNVHESPAFIYRNGKSIIAYSTGGLLDPGAAGYKTGILTNTNGNYLSASSWVKSSGSVFQYYSGVDGEVYAPGACRFIKSPDGTEDWLIYHAKHFNDANYNREIRAQKFTWDSNNNPIFGTPTPSGVILDVPSGQILGDTAYIQDFESAQINGNYISDSEASNYGGGATWRFGIDSSNPISGAKSVYFNITNTGTDWWNLQYKVDSRFSVKKGDVYRISFKVKSLFATTIMYKVLSVANLSQSIDLAGNGLIQNFSVITTPMDRDGNDSNFQFSLGNLSIPTTIWIDDIVIEKVNVNTYLKDAQLNNNIKISCIDRDILVNSNAAGKIELYTLTGSLIYSQKIFIGENQIRLLNKGQYYIVKVVTTGNVKIIKILVY